MHSAPSMVDTDRKLEMACSILASAVSCPAKPSSSSSEEIGRPSTHGKLRKVLQDPELSKHTP